MKQSAAPSRPIGLVVRRSAHELGSEPFYVDFIAGMERTLATRGLQVLLQLVGTLDEELACYHRWASSGSVAGVTIVDLVPDDPRLPLVHELGLPAVVVGEPEPGGPLPAVRSDGETPMWAAVAALAELGHRRLARVTGPSRLLHTRERTGAFDAAVRKLGLLGQVVEGDYSARSGADATRRLLAASDAPTAIIYDNDVMAVSGLETAIAAGVDVPGHLSLLAWDDSAACRLAFRPLSAMSHDVHAVGELVGHSLIAVLDDATPPDVYAPLPTYVRRATTASAPAATAAPEGAGAATR